MRKETILALKQKYKHK